MSVAFTEDDLRTAAGKVRQAMLAAMPADGEYCHEFSNAFKTRMQVLVSRARRREQMRKYTRRAAAIALAALVGVSTWLAVDTEARAATLRWMREIYGNSIIFHFFGDENKEADLSYEPTWLPDGCTKYKERGDDTGKRIAYRNADNEPFYFSCNLMNEGLGITIIFDDEFIVEPADVNGMEGEFYISNDPEESGELSWVDEENDIIFSVSGRLTQEEMLQMAESVCLVTKQLPYEPAWLPDGCIKVTENSNAVGKTIVYHDINDELLFFRCYRMHDGLQGQSIFDSEFEVKPTEVNGMNGEFYIPSDPTEYSELSWVDEENGIIFSVIGCLTQDEFLKIAGSVD